MTSIMTAILAIESATGPCSAAVWKDGGIAAYVENTSPVVQSAKLLPMAEQVLKESGLTYKELSAVAATVGPGSFTGIRVALAAARGICLAANIKGLGFTTLDVLAYGARQHFAQEAVPILALLNAGKGEYYYRHYDATGKPSSTPSLGALETALVSAQTPFITVGNTPGACPINFLRADLLAALAATNPSALSLSPFYIRPPDAKLPSKII